MINLSLMLMNKCITHNPNVLLILRKVAALNKLELMQVEASVCIRQRAPLQVNSWKDIREDDYEGMWKHIEGQLDLSEDVKDHAMKQL
ncbi:hypothetical protein RIF29_30525 [Crotalaria pallida]|uniref:Uncharacterized protein n=1 Tax=Crotalaria pallida TaxID=3830 RepID=A0AAN9EGK8_CROPI